MEWWRKRLYLFILALLLWGNASGLGVWNQKTVGHWQVGGVNSQDQAGSLFQQGNVTVSGAQTSERVPNAVNPSSPNPVYSSTGFLHPSSDPQRSLVRKLPSVLGASSGDVPSSTVQMGVSGPGSNQYAATRQQTSSSQSQYMPASQHRTVNKPLPQVSFNLDPSVAQDQGNLGAQVQGSTSSTSRWGSALALSQGMSQTAYKPTFPAQLTTSAVVSKRRGSLVSQSTGFRWPNTSASVGVHTQVPASPNATLTQSTYKPLAPAQASGASAVVSMGQAQSTSAFRWPTFSGSSHLLSQTRGTSQKAVGALTQVAYKPVLPSQTSSQSTVGSWDQVSYGTQSVGSSRWSSSTGSMRSQLPSQAQGTSQSSGGSLTQTAFKPVFPSSDATTFSGSLGRYGVPSAVSNWPTSSGSVSPQFVSQRVNGQYGSVLGAQTNVPSSPAQVFSASTVLSPDKSTSGWSASRSLSAQLLSQTQDTSSQMIYKPVTPSQGSSLSTVVAQGSGAQSTGFGWPASGPVSSQLFAQGTSSQYVSRFVTKPNVSQLPSSVSSQSVVSRDQVSYGAQSTGSHWSTSGQLGVQSPPQEQAVSLAQTSSDSMASRGSSGTQASSHATWHRVPSSTFWQSNMPQYGRVTFNVPSAPEAYSNLVSTLHTSAASVPVSQPQVLQSGPAVLSNQYGGDLVSKGTRFSAAQSQGPSVSKLQELSPVSMDVSSNQLTSGSSGLYSGSQGYSFAPAMKLPSFLRPAPWHSSDPPVSMGKQ